MASPIGALLRVTHAALTHSILQRLRDQGIEMTETEFNVMRYPGPDGVRPTDLASRCNMTKQAMNYVLSGFQANGYIERRSEPGRRATAIFLTPEGRKLLATTRRCANEIELTWAAQIGRDRFDALRSALFEIATWLGEWHPISPNGIHDWAAEAVSARDRRKSAT
jgi:DNA-binding MarR family transcriptional regulator